MEIGESYRKRCHRYNFAGNAHELTFSCFHNRPFLKSERTCNYLVDAIIAAKVKHAFDVWAYVFMPEHVHLLICPRRETYSIAEILCAIKQPVSRRALIYLRGNRPEGLKWLATAQQQSPYHFWQVGGGYDRNMSSVPTINKAVQYIHENPVRRGLVRHPSEWLYSSDKDWETGVSLRVPIDFDTFPRA
jgi:putative transposase